MAAVRKRIWQLSGIRAFGASKSKVSSSLERPIFHSFHVSGIRHYRLILNMKNLVTKPVEEGVPSKPIIKISFPLDTLNLVKKLEEQGVSSENARSIAGFLINDLLKTEMQGGHHFFRLQPKVQIKLRESETEKKLRNVREKMRSVLRDDLMKLWIVTMVLISPLLLASGKE